MDVNSLVYSLIASCSYSMTLASGWLVSYQTITDYHMMWFEVPSALKKCFD
jgi:hypothetical protein